MKKFISANQVKEGDTLCLGNPKQNILIERVTVASSTGSIGLHGNDDTWTAFYGPNHRVRIACPASVPGVVKRNSSSYHHRMIHSFLVNAEWDADAKVWVASSEAVPGLSTEAKTLEALDAKLQTLIPELLDANKCLPSAQSIQVELQARKYSTANLIHAL